MKKYVKSVFVAAIATVAGYNVYQSQSVMNGVSDFALANVEALAASENGCVNKPGQNDGHCATDGIFYLCENKGSKDCVIGLYP